MKFWYFKFEGEFMEESQNYGDGIFSGCLVPESNYQKAKSMFLRSLSEQFIRQIDITEHFAVDGEELDPSDVANMFWIKWYQKTKTSKQVEHDTWHVYDLEK